MLHNAVRVGGGVGGCQISNEKRYEDVRFNVSSVTRGWLGIEFPEKKRYA